jgi:hypothetical protein
MDANVVPYTPIMLTIWHKSLKDILLTQIRETTEKHILPHLKEHPSYCYRPLVVNDIDLVPIVLLKNYCKIIIEIPCKYPVEIQEIEALFVKNRKYFDFILNRDPVIDSDHSGVRIIY